MRSVKHSAARLAPLAFAAVVSLVALVVSCGSEDFSRSVPDAGGPCPPASVASCPAQPAPIVRPGESGMVIVPRSCLQVGCDPARQGCLPSDPAPRLVELGPFQVDKTEVTRSDLARCIEDGACPRTQQPAELRQQGPLPAGKVTFAEAQAFCKFAGKRLPTADEWELAARGPDGRLYPWGNDVSNCSRARTRECGGGDARDVGTLPAGASPYGALDMAGNVAEIVSPTACELANRPATLQIARRGGSYLDEVPATRATSLAYAAESAASSGVGFRCVKDAIPPDAGL